MTTEQLRREAIEPEFSMGEIEDIRIIVKAKGKHYGIVPKEGVDKEEAKLTRIALFSVLIDNHAVVNKALEDLNK